MCRNFNLQTRFCNTNLEEDLIYIQGTKYPDFVLMGESICNKKWRGGGKESLFADKLRDFWILSSDVALFAQMDSPILVGERGELGESI